MSLLDEEVKRWFDSQGSVADYREALQLLRRSGLMTILKRIGSPAVINFGENPHIMAGQAHWSNGFLSCIDHLVYFERMFADHANPVSLSPPDFGGVQAALESGSLREEDL